MNTQDYAALLNLGIDSDWLKTGDRRRSYQQLRLQGVSLPQIFKTKGFDHVRLRIKDYDLETIDPETDLTLLQEIEIVVQDCLKVGLVPIIAFQAEEFKAQPTALERNRVVTWWQSVATRLKGYSDRLSCNFLIESTLNVRQNDAALNDLYAQCYAAVQAIDPGRICIACPSLASDPERLTRLKLPGKFCFTESHFAAGGFSKTNSEKLWTVGTAAEKKIVTDKLDLMVAHRARTASPVWFGALMLGSTNSPDETDEYSIAEQVAIAQFVIAEVKKRSIPIAFNADDRYFDYGALDWKEEQRPVLDMLTL